MNIQEILATVKPNDLISVDVGTVPRILNTDTIYLPLKIKFRHEMEEMEAEVGVGISRFYVGVAIDSIVKDKHFPTNLVTFVPYAGDRNTCLPVNNYRLGLHLAYTELRNSINLGELRTRSEVFAELLQRDSFLRAYLSTVYLPDWKELAEGLTAYYQLSRTAMVLYNKTVPSEIEAANPMLLVLASELHEDVDKENVGHRNTIITTLLKEFERETYASPYTFEQRFDMTYGLNKESYVRINTSDLELLLPLKKSLGLLEYGHSILGFSGAHTVPESFIHLFYHTLFTKYN